MVAFPRDINNEMVIGGTLHKQYLAAQKRKFYSKFRGSKFPYYYCVSCGKYILADHNMATKHLKEVHGTHDYVNKRDREWRLHPSTGFEGLRYGRKVPV